MDIFLEKKGIFQHFVGGLGNQMFQLAAGYIASRTNHCPLYYVKTTNEYNPHQKNLTLYADTLFSPFQTQLEAADPQHLQLLKHMFYKDHYTSMTRPWQAWDPATTEPGTVLGGYYQYYPALKPFEFELRSKFTQGLQTYLDIAAKTVKSATTSAFLHIRRGDFLEHTSITYQTPLSYYTTCINTLLKNKNIDVIYILSDDLEYIQSIPEFKSPLFQPVLITDELIGLAIMAQCKAGAICGNSTYSWWGAFLGAYGYRSPIFVPHKWHYHTTQDDQTKLFPEEWNVVKYD